MKGVAAVAAMAILGVGLATAGLGLLVRGTASEPAWAQTTGTDRVALAATPLADGTVVITMLDVGAQRLAVYQADGRRSRLKLVAVRDISADWELTEYNNEKPLPSEIREMVRGMATGEAAP